MLRVVLLLVAALAVCTCCATAAGWDMVIVTSNCDLVKSSGAVELLCSDKLSTLIFDVATQASDDALHSVSIQSDPDVLCNTIKKREIPLYTVVCPLPQAGLHHLFLVLQDGSRVITQLHVSSTVGPALSVASEQRTARTLSGEAHSAPCQHGQIDEDGLCQCDLFYAGEDCSIPCPGLRVSGCSDTGCYGASSAQCGDACSWSSTLNICTGVDSCIENVCSGQGTCSWGRNADASCQCASGYFGKTCETLCSTHACQDKYAITTIECSSDGACICSGHYGTLSTLCTDCKAGWYGTDCESECLCSGHGACEQLTGVCSCFEDDASGYWTGSSCSICKPGYTGSDCQEKNLVLGAGPIRNITATEYNPRVGVSPSVGALITTSSSQFHVGYGSFVAMCNPTDTISEKSSTLTCDQTTVNGTVCDAQERGTVIVHLTIELSVNSTIVHLLNESIDRPWSVVEVASWTLSPLQGDQQIVSAQLSLSAGWFIVLSDGSVASQNNLAFQPPVSVPPGATFTAHSAAFSESGGRVYIAGSYLETWVLHVFSLQDHTFTTTLSAATLSSLSEYTTAIAVAVQSGESVALVVTNATAVAFAHLSALPEWHITSVLVDKKREEFTSAVLKIGLDEVLYLTAVTTAGVRVHTTHWSEHRVMSTQLIAGSSQEKGVWQPLVALMPASSVLVFVTQSSLTFDIEIRSYSAFAAEAVVPAVIDRSGGTTLTIVGHSFPSSLTCLFSDGSNSAPTVVNSTTVMCTVPFLHANRVFSQYYIEVSAPVRWLCGDCAVATTNQVTVSGFAAPAPTRAYASNNKSYASIHSRAPITVQCLGAPNLDTLLCRFEDDAGMSLISPASFVSSELVICQMPIVTRPSSGTSGVVTISIDGSVFSPGTPFTFIGDAANLKLMSVPTVDVTASDRIEFPTALIHVVDSEGHSLSELDSTRVVNAMALWFNSTRKELDSFISAYQSVVLSTYSNQTKLGETSFGVSLQYPRIGVGMLAFSSAGLGQALLSFSVREGVPASMSLAIAPEPRIDNLHANKSRQPVIIFRDVADNTVYNLTTTSGEGIRKVAVTFNKGTSLVTTEAARNSNGYFEFNDVYSAGLFGRVYEFVFASPGFTNITSWATMADCYPDQYAMYGTTNCLPCPSKAICNGSYSFNLTDGVWKGGELAYTVIACPLEVACVGGQCATGYSGPLCATCSQGYGKSGLLCKACYSTAANIIIIVLVALTFVAFLFGLVVLLHQMAGPHFRAMQTLIIMINFLQVIAVVVYPLTELPVYLNDFVTVLRVLGFCNVLRLAALTCLGMNAYSAFIVCLVAPLAAVPIFRAVLWEADKMNSRHFRKLEEERRILRSFAPYESPEAYYSRITFLGIDDEPAFRNENASSIEKLEVQKGRIRQAYALLDKNSSAFTAISQMAHSKARETALRTLVDEREELLAVLRRYESFISLRNGGGRGTKQSSSLFPPQLSQPHMYGVGSSGVEGGGSRVPGGSNDTVTDLEATRASGLSGTSHATCGSRGGQFGSEEVTKDPTRGNFDESEVEPTAGGADDDEALLARFPELTTTQLTLFGERESFNPIRQNINFSKDLESEEERNVARVMRRASAGVSFVWPTMPHKALFLLLTFTYYLYNVTVGSAFALVRCADINYGIESRDNTREETRSVLRGDYSITCGNETHEAYRIAGIVVGSVYGGGMIVMIFFVFLTRRKKDRLSRFFAFSLGLRLERAWWAGVTLLERFVLVIMAALVGGHVGAMVSFWVLAVLLLAFMQIRPMMSLFLYRAEIVSRTLSIIVCSLQLLPFLNAADEDDYTTGNISGAFVVIVVCCGIAGFLTVAFVELVSPGNVHHLFRRGIRYFDYVKARKEDSTDHSGDARPRSPTPYQPGIERAPFSFETYNAALVSKHLQQSEVCSQEKRGILDHQMNALFRQRSSSLSGRSKTMTTVWLTGVAAVGGVSNVELLADFIDSNEVYVEKPKELQRELQKYTADPFASIRNLEKEIAWEHLVLREHAQQLDNVVARLTQIAQSGPSNGAFMGKRVH